MTEIKCEHCKKYFTVVFEEGDEIVRVECPHCESGMSVSVEDTDTDINKIIEMAMDEVNDIQFTDNTWQEAYEEKKQVKEIIRRMAQRILNSP